MNKTQSYTSMKRGVLLTATSLVAVSINASNTVTASTYSYFVPCNLESSALVEYMSNASIYYYPVPVDYRALYKKITQSEWYIQAHRDASIGDEMPIE